MAKDSVIISVSCSKSQADFLDEKNLSPSGLFQEIINQQINNFDRFNNENKKLDATIQFMKKEIEGLYAFIDEIGCFEDFKKWRGTHVLEKE